MKKRNTILFIVLSVAVVMLFLLDVGTGSVGIPLGDVWRALLGRDVDPTTIKIVRDIRLVKALVAIATGVALSVSGLLMQTLFRNPLAGPYVLGISSGASLGVAIFILGAPILGLAASSMGTVVGIAAASNPILTFTNWSNGESNPSLSVTMDGDKAYTAVYKIKDIMVILILGMMFSSGVSALVQVLQYLSNEEALKSFVIWTMGSLGDVTASQLWLLIPAVVLGMVISIAVIKPLNLLLLGENYARTMGLNVKHSRQLIFLATTLLAGTVTAFCGPISFVGLAVPHVARALFREADHRVLMPGAALCGAVVLLFCDLISKLLTLPINTITALLGIPIVIWVVIRNK